MDTTLKGEYHIRDLSTRSVTLFPSRAQIVREIKNVTLSSGANQITIVGLTPTVDEHSIKIDGTGSAIITDIAVELLPNRHIFQDTYPDSDDDSNTDSESDEEEDRKESKALKDIRARIASLDVKNDIAKETISSAASRLKILDSYGTLLTSDRKHAPNESIDEGIEKYRAEREKVFRDHTNGLAQSKEILKARDAALTEEQKLLREEQKERDKAAKIKAKALKLKEKEKAKVARKRAEAAKEKARIRKERESFWPKKTYTIKVTLEAASFTPMSSRRNSISSDIIKPIPEQDSTTPDEISTTCDLSITYVTTYAFWSPSYDLALSTTSNSGQLCFDARLTNQTSETWSNCKVILSTSQTDFSGLNDAIPILRPWRVRLKGKGNVGSHNDIMYSNEEQNHKASWTSQQNARAVHKPRAELFGLDHQYWSGPQRGGGLFGNPHSQPSQPTQASSMFGRSVARHTETQQQPANANTFGVPGANSVSHVGGLFAVQSAPLQQTSLFGSAAPSAAIPPPPPPAPSTDTRDEERQRGDAPRILHRSMQGATTAAEPTSSFGEELGVDDEATISEPQPELSFLESSFEETGFTSTYDLPGLKTLAPSTTASKQRVARVTFSNVAFSHTVVAKYKPVAYLKSKLRNSSTITLLKGPTSLTLDGSFMGRTTIPRCSPGDLFVLSLGVDPAIRVAYPKPDVKRSQSGLFSKEDSGLYTRTITLINTRSGAKGKPVQVTVLDQIPVSEDERLRIDILQPRGLVLGGNGVAAGLPGREGKDEKLWGKAISHFKKDGEITWDVTLNAGRAVKLGLEYEIAFPTGEHVGNV